MVSDRFLRRRRFVRATLRHPFALSCSEPSAPEGNNLHLPTCNPETESSKIIIVTVTTTARPVALARPVSPAEEVLRGPIKSKTIFPALVLHLLALGPEHGYGLLGRIEAICGDLIAVNTNTIYPLLRRLEERGFIEGEWDHPTKRARRHYRITPAGRERLIRIKANMLPYLDILASSIERLRTELYEEPHHG